MQFNIISFSNVFPWAPAGFFSRGGQIRGSKNESPPAGSRNGALVGVWGPSPQKPTKNCENNAQIIGLLSILL